MKKVSLFLATILMLSVVLTGCGGSGNTSSSEASPAPSEASAVVEEPTDEPAPGFESQASGGTLIMATEAGFKPYEYYEGQEIVGVDVEIAKEIAAAMGKELLIENMEFGSIIPAVKSGKADFGAAGMSITEERKEQIDFTIEYATSKQVILTKAGSDIKGEENLTGKTVGVQLGTVADYALAEDYPDVKLQQYNKYFEAANDLKAGRIDAIVMDVLPAQELVTTGDDLVILEKELFTDVYAFCVRKGNTELLDTINSVMQKLMDEGKIVEFTTKHSA